MTRAQKPPLMHPLVVLAMPLTAVIAVLLADGVRFGLLCLAAGLIAACARGLRFALTTLLLTISGIAVLWLGFAVALPAEPDGALSPIIEWLPLRPTEAVALLALRGALRIVTIMVLYVVAFAYVDWRVLADTLIDRLRVPYRVVDVIGLGGRFAVLIRRDVATSRVLTLLRSRGHVPITFRLRSRLVVPVLMAAFRHADELTIAMETRGFGALPERTVHHSVPLRPRDGIVLAALWMATVALAAALQA